jgi:ribonuclease-3
VRCAPHGPAELQQALDYAFASPELLRRALVHKSYRNENPSVGEDNERLEFLGDAVLSLVVGHRLMELRPDASEGDLTRMRAAVVNEAALAQVAERLSLGELLLLGRGEEQTGGRRKPSLLADACEAVVGAAYLDGGFGVARALCERLFGEALRQAAETLAREADAKTRLQEWTQARSGEPPSYALVAQQGPDHALTFEVALSVAGRELSRGRGRSKKEAEQRAAQLALDALREEPGE